MSRIGKKPIAIPKGVTIAVQGQTLTCKGPKGSLVIAVAEGVKANVAGDQLSFERTEDSRLARAMHGTSRALVQNAIVGVTQGYEKKLEIVGVGYRAVVQGKKVALNVGFANTIEVAIPDGITVKVPDQTHIEISGIDKQLVGQVAANLRAARKPEPYKGKGVRYLDEVVRKKAGKAAAAGAGAGAKK